MANQLIRPSNLPSRANPVSNEVVPSDNGSTVAKVTWADGVAAGRPLANQGEAEAGANGTNAMTPLTTKQAIDAQVPTKISAALTSYTPTSGLSAVAISNDYGDLDNLPTLGTMAAEDATSYTPTSGLGSAAFNNTGDFATSAQGAAADTAVQPGDLGGLALKDKIGVPGDITASGTASSSTFLRGDGSWQAVSGGGSGDMLKATYDPTSVEADAFDSGNTVYTPPGTGASARSVESKLNDIVSLINFGADPTGTADSTSAFTNGIAYLNTLGGGTLFIPPGVYKTTNPISIAVDNINIVGSGVNATTIQPDFSSPKNAFSLGDTEYVRIADLSIRGDSDTSGYVATGIEIGNSYRPTLERLNIEFCYRNIHFKTGVDKHYHAYLHNIRTNYGATGLQIGESGVTSQPWQNVIIQNCSFGAATDVGVRIYAVGGLQWNEGEVIYCDESLRIDPKDGQFVKGVMFTNIFFDTPDGNNITFNVGSPSNTGLITGVCFTGCSINNAQTGHGISMEGNTSGDQRIESIRFVGCEFIINAKQGLYMQGSKNVDVYCCHFISNGVSSSNTYEGLSISDHSDNVRVDGGMSGKSHDFSSYQKSGINVSPNVTNTIIKNISLADNLTAGLINDGSSDLVVMDCKGFKTTAKGTALFTSGNSTAVVTHGLAATPTNEDIRITQVQDFEGRRLWINGTPTSTTFTVAMDASLGSDRYFTWEATIYNR